MNETNGESVLLRKYRARIRELEEQLDSLQKRKSSASFGPKGATQANVNLSTIEERQMELKFAINNINRVILNSGAQQISDASSVAATPSISTGSTSTSNSRQMRDRPLPPEIRTQAEQAVPEAREDDNNEDEDDDEYDEEGGNSRSNSNRTLIGSGGSRASTKTLPLSSSSSLPTTDGGDFESKDIIEEEPEDEEQAASRMFGPGISQQQRASLTTMLKSKYSDELIRMDQRAGRWNLRPNEEIQPQKELLKEFVRGLEIAEAEQETRMSKIEELELENRQLRQILQSREDELMAIKNIRPEDETF